MQHDFILMASHWSALRCMCVLEVRNSSVASDKTIKMHTLLNLLITCNTFHETDTAVGTHIFLLLMSTSI